MRINEDYIDDLKDNDLASSVDKVLNDDLYETVKDNVRKLIDGKEPDISLVELPDAFFKPGSFIHLRQIIRHCILIYGNRCNLNWIDVSRYPEFDDLFYKSKFNGDISRWNTSNATSMYEMFRESEFNGDISNWDVSHVTNMSGMFYYAKFNKDISNWDVSRVENMDYMFA